MRCKEMWGVVRRGSVWGLPEARGDGGDELILKEVSNRTSEETIEELTPDQDHSRFDVEESE